jgi:hypothetical protein
VIPSSPPASDTGSSSPSSLQPPSPNPFQ